MFVISTISVGFANSLRFKKGLNKVNLFLVFLWNNLN